MIDYSIQFSNVVASRYIRVFLGFVDSAEFLINSLQAEPKIVTDSAC